MNSCKIIPIPIFKRDHELSGILFRTTVKRNCTIGGFAWLIDGDGHKILVDTGANVDYIKNVKRDSCEEVQTLETGLKKLGLTYKDIDTVIFTHLHHDHCAQARYFPHARLIAQADEIDFAFNPHPFFSNAYPLEFIKGVVFEPVEGDVKITQNISVMKTPGHTVGGQSVAVRTSKGLAIISGLCSINENFNPSLIGSSFNVIPPTPHVNVIQACESMDKIKKVAEILIANHEPGYLNGNEIS
jgi:N-acyl homoserine lactone hydrolase